MKKYIFFLIPLLFINTLYSQVLYEETFDNYTLGSFYKGTGNWNFLGNVPEIVQEPNRGNVLAIRGNQVNTYAWQYVSQMWSNKTAGHNILLVEYDVYYEDFLNNNNVEQHNSELTLHGVTGGYLFRILFTRGYNYGGSPMSKSNVEVFFDNNILKKDYNNINFTKSWFTVKLYIDYDTNKKYVYIPALNIVKEEAMGATISVLDRIAFGSRVIAANATGYTGVIAKYDNIRMEALKTLPQELIDAILSNNNEQLTAKFNLYPNPANNVITITNNENMFVKEVAVYDTTGKQLSTQSFNNEAEIQLNVENLASGTYLLHLQTAVGTAVKKLVKK